MVQPFALVAGAAAAKASRRAVVVIVKKKGGLRDLCMGVGKGVVGAGCWGVLLPFIAVLSRTHLHEGP